MDKPLLRVGAFHYPPFIIEEKLPGQQELRYTGIEVSIVRAIASYLGYEAKFLNPSDGNLWGTMFKNGTVSGGLLKDLQKGVVDVGIAQLFNMVFNKNKHVSYSLNHMCSNSILGIELLTFRTPTTWMATA